MTLLEKMMEIFDGIPLIDTHSHLCPVEAEYNASGDILTDWVPAYLLDDLRSAGLTEKHAEVILDSGRDLIFRWRLLEPFGNKQKIQDMPACGSFPSRDCTKRNRLQRIIFWN